MTEIKGDSEQRVRRFGGARARARRVTYTHTHKGAAPVAECDTPPGGHLDAVKPA